MSRDKYGVGNDLYCYPGTATLKNLLDIRDDAALSDAERDLTSDAADKLDFISPPYDLDSLKAIHRHLLRASIRSPVNYVLSTLARARRGFAPLCAFSPRLRNSLNR